MKSIHVSLGFTVLSEGELIFLANAVPHLVQTLREARLKLQANRTNLLNDRHPLIRSLQEICALL